MQILIIATSYYPHIGGVEYVVKSTAERLVRKGHNVTVIAGILPENTLAGGHQTADLGAQRRLLYPTHDKPAGKVAH